MTRFTLLASLSTFAVIAHGAAAQTAINGGGAASQQFDYGAPNVNGTPVAELPLFNSLQSAVAFGTYWSTTSGNAQKGLITNDLTCVINGQTGNNGGQCAGNPGGSNTMHYAVSEAALGTTQVSSWATASTGQAAAGNLIQLPALGTGLAIIFNDTNITRNGEVVLSDNDLCGIFSGKITNFNQITDSKKTPAAGAFKLVYRSDSAGTTNTLTNHLSAVCNSSNTLAGVTFRPTSSFSSLFGTPITNQIPGAVGISGLSATANYMAGLSSGPVPQGIGYISPDWTSVDSATSSAKLSDGKPSPLLVAALNGAGGRIFQPIKAAIEEGLLHPAIGQNLTPPTTAAAGANPVSWVPVIQTVTKGYPMVAYSTIDLPQCYADPTVTAGILAFLNDHYTASGFTKIQGNNGLVTVANSGAAKFLKAIQKNLLANGSNWNVNIGNATACAGKVGR